jgi:hypothetical protein
MKVINQNLIPLANTAIAATITATVLLVILHAIESEFDPTWRMVSEYSNGQYGLLMRLAFLLTGIATFSIAMLLRRVKGSKLTKVASIAFFVSFIGLMLAALFNQDPVTSKEMTFHGNMHGLATMLGIPGFGIGAALAGLWLKARGAGTLALVVGYSTLVTFFAMLIYLFTGISKDTGFAPGTCTGVFNRVVWIAMIASLVYFANKLSKSASK